MITLRPYQRQALDALYGYFEHHDGHPILILPTAAGKSLIIATFLREVLSAWQDQRILCLTHVKELVEQDALELFNFWPEAPAGIYAAGLNRRDIGDAITFASIQSVYKRSSELGSYDLIVIDECHLVPPSSDGMYRTFLAAQTALNPAIRVIGLTATHYRLGQGMLHEGKHALFTDVAYEVTVAELLAGGFLSPLTTAPVRERLNVTGVETRNGEFVAGALEAAIDQEVITKAACAEIVALGESRRSWLVFCPGIRHAGHVRDELAARGISAALLTGDTPPAERDRMTADYKRGTLRALVNVNVATTGFNAPQTDLIAMLRPTQSPGLYQQILGRGMRTAPDKENCAVLDFAGNISRHGPVDDVRPPRAPGDKGGGEAPHKKCPKCKARMHPKALYCGDCGFEFPEKSVHDETAATAAVMLADAAAVRYENVTVDYLRHEKVGAPPSLRVDYYVGYRRIVSEWICLEHAGFARSKARIWWRKRTNSEPPSSVDEAMAHVHSLAVPSAIIVNERQKFPEIVAAEFSTVPSRQLCETGSPFSKAMRAPMAADFDDDIPF